MGFIDVNSVLAGLKDFGVDTTEASKQVDRELAGELTQSGLSTETLANFLVTPPCSAEESLDIITTPKI